MAVFKDYAKYYDLLYSGKDYQKEVSYIHQLIKRFQPGAKTILDLGCGTGRHDVLLARQGYKIKGIDVSDSMVALAKKVEIPESVEFQVADATKYQTSVLYDVVLSLFHVVNYQSSNQSLIDFFATAYSHLRSGGVFIFDSWYGPAVLTDRPQKKTKIIENEQLRVVRHTTPELQVNSNIALIHFDVEIQNKITKEVNQLTENHPMRYLFYPEVEILARQAGFQIVMFTKWMEETQPDDASWYVTFCLLKN
jgi:SAM-dependent methyltransferase